MPNQRRRLKVYFDGGCRPNPGPIEAAVVIRGMVHLFDDLGHGSNSDAEWLALHCALRLARDEQLGDIELIGDAVQIVQRATEVLDTGTPRSDHEAELLILAADLPKPKLRWVRRAKNLAGIALAARHPR